jgi:ABC-2 type transport system ATP-binding protein
VTAHAAGPATGGASAGKSAAEAAGIEATGLVREFKKGPRAVDGIDLQVAPGEIYGFLGPNGAGKSTTVLMLTTLLPPTAGTALVAGHDVVHEGPAVRRAIGASLQESALDPFLTGREHTRLQSALHGLGKAERVARGDELLARVGLTEAADRKVGGYSGGMKRRLDLALALVHSPRILFLDEPTTGLDVQSRTALWDEVGRLAREDGVTVFLTTQYLEEADVLADRLGIIDRGRIVAEGTPAELKATIGRPSVEAVPENPGERDRLAAVLRRFGEEAAATAKSGVAARLPEGVGDLAEIVRTLDAEGIAIADLRLHAPTLDDVFLAKTGRSLEGAGERDGDGGGDGDSAIGQDEPSKPTAEAMAG